MNSILNQNHSVLQSQNVDSFSILNHLDSLNIVKETSGEYHCTCPLCDAGGFKIDKATGKYNTFVCGCMDTDQGKKTVIQAIARLEPKDRHYQSPRHQVKPKAKAPKLPLIEGTVTLAKFEVIPTDFPQPGKPSFIPDKVPDDATLINYRYSPTQFIKRFDWEDPSKQPKGRDKTFRQYYVNAEGELTPGKGDDPWPLYRESEVITAKGWVLFQEGEVCVDTARCTLGLVSTTLQGSNWSEDAIAAALTRLKEAGLPGLVFISDNDDPGEAKGKKVLSASIKIDFPVIVTSIKQLWEDAPEKGDLADWVKWGQANGMNTEDFIKRLEAEIHTAVNRRSQEIQPKKSQNNEVEQVKILIKQWLLEDDPLTRAMLRIEVCRKTGLDKTTFDLIADSLDENSSKPKAKRLKPHEFMVLPTSGTPLLAPGIASMGVTIIAGNPGAGKTTLAYDLAGAVLMGDEFLGEVTSRQGSVLFVNCDEPHQWGQDKLINRGITSNYEVLMDWDVTQWSALETAVEDMRPALIVIDSFNAIHNDPNFDENSAQASQTVKKLDRLSAKYCVPTALIHHLGKSKDNKGINKLRGSTAIASSASSVLILEGEGTHKRLYQPKSRGSEPLDLTVEMDCENGRFRVTGGNITDDATKSVSQRLKDFYTVNPGLYERIELDKYFPDIDRKQLTNGLNRLLGTVINGLPFIKRPSKINPRFKIYGIESTNDDNSSQFPPLSPSSFPLNFDDVTSESIDIQESQQITTTSQVTSQPRHNQNDDDPIVTPETLIQTENHQIITDSQPRGERVPPVADDHDAVLIFGSVETASIIEVEMSEIPTFENHQIVEFENVANCHQNSEPSKNETGFAFELGDRGRIGQRIKDKTTGEIHTITSIENGRYYCEAQDSFTSIPFVDALTDLDPDEF
jgi:hypothetical protein